MLLCELLAGLEYRLFGLCTDIFVTEPFCDSREAVKGGLFICIKGTVVNGADFAEDAFQKGAVAAVACERIAGRPTVVVPDTRYAAAVIWNNYYKRPSRGMRLYGITGTNGKTSTLHFLSSCLRADGRKTGTIGTLGAFSSDGRIEIKTSEKAEGGAAMTTPDPKYLYGILAEFRSRGITDVVMEVSSHSILQRKTDALRFCTGIFTNLSPEHLDTHETMEEYYRVKASFVARCERRIVNKDSPECRRFAAAVPSLAVGIDDVSDITVDSGGVEYTFRGARVSASVGGEFTVYNSLLAIVAANKSGVSLERCVKGVKNVESICGRLERVVRKEDAGFDVIIDYAHTPDALEGVLCHLRKLCSGDIICVFGCGGNRDRKKRPLMGKIAQSFADGVIVTGDNPRDEDPLRIIEDILSGMKGDNCVIIPERRNAIYAAVSMAKRGDCILLAGKGHEKYEIRGGEMREFDERDIVAEAVKLKYGK